MLPCVTCVELRHMGMWLLQVRPIQVGYLWFGANSCRHVATSIQNWTMDFGVGPYRSCAFMLCGSLCVCYFAQVPYPCPIVCTTFGFWTPSHLVFFCDCHSLLHGTSIHRLVIIMILCESSVIQLFPSPHKLVVGPICCRSSCPWHKKFPAKNGVSIGPMCLQTDICRMGS